MGPAEWQECGGNRTWKNAANLSTSGAFNAELIDQA
jgi:hypothetical protein